MATLQLASLAVQLSYIVAVFACYVATLLEAGYGQRNTYWCTTGLYPQSFIITFPNPVIISLIKIRSYLELDITDHCHQVKLLHEAKFIARHLRFTIRSGYDHVCAVYRVEVQGVHKSGGNEIRGDESDVLESGGPLTTPIRQVDRSLPMAHVNEVAHAQNSIQSIQHASKGSLLGDGTERFVVQSAGRRNFISSSMVPPLWNEEDKEREEA
ncbi:hypothetical protein B7P43_G05436 [Cryptotermes secundus]|uniref:Uncharacterized protein n=1 Tax=Cryptotermes secundus TaxID=105785 RepID=A0A2J7RP18_9NEOP|nr:hypothetical protein B7P43_G05436 [Cryptotermes secundus]